MSGNRFVDALAVCLLLSPAAFAQVNISIGPNVNVSKRSGSESETSIAIDKSNTNRVVILSNWGSSGMFHATTTNSGSSWGTGFLSTPAWCDSWLGCDSFGNIYLSYLTTSATTRIARSINGGATFADILAVSGSSDHPELSVGPGVTAGTQSVWVTHARSGIRALGATSTGLGSTSTFTSESSSMSSSGNFGSIAIGPNGQVATTFMASSGSSGPSNLPVYTDANGTTGGATFTQVNNSITTQVGGFRSIPAQPNRTIDTQVDLKYDYSGGDKNGQLYMLYTQAANTTTSDTNIVIRRSTDNGATWSGETRINDDVGTKSQFFGRLAVDQKTGYLASVWLDARNSSANTLVELWGSISIDGGVTWLPNFKISQGQWDGRQSNTGDPNEMGDYISLDFYDGKIAVAWADASNSTGDNPNGTAGLDIYYDSIIVTPIPEPATVGLVAMLGVVGGWGFRRKTARAPVPAGPAC